jgi:phosphoglycolate phosphatase
MTGAALRRTVLLDLDGTLTDNHEGITRSIVHALAALGAPAPDAAALAACIGPPLRTSFARLLATTEVATVERALAHYRARYAQVGWQENFVYAGIHDALDALATGGARLILCTSKPQPFAERIVARFDLAPRLAGVYGADLAGTLDDKARLMAHLIAREGLDAAACTMVGDRHHDIDAARANGVRTVGVLWGYGSRTELEAAGAQAFAATPAELPGAVAGLKAP